MFNNGQFNSIGFNQITLPDTYDADVSRDIQAEHTYDGDSLREVVLHLDNFALGADVTGDLYSNGLLHVYGTGATYDYTYGNSLVFEDTRITDIQIDSGVTTIGDHLFYGLSNLESISIADSVVSIGESAFTGCNNLEEIINNYEGSQTVGANAFTTSGSSVSPKYAYGWKANSTFITQVETAGYYFSALDPAEVFFFHHTFPSTDNVMFNCDVIRSVCTAEDYDADTFRNILTENVYDADTVRDIMKLYEEVFDTKRSIVVDVYYDADTVRSIVVEGVYEGDTLRRVRHLVPVKRRQNARYRPGKGSPKRFSINPQRFPIGHK